MITVLEPGLLTTVQDLGRFGYQRFGVSPAGALDAVALRLANALVGNEPGAAGLEITLKGPRLAFDEACLIALGGADLSAELDGKPLPPWQAAKVGKGSVLSFGRRVSGCRCYLAVAGGIAVDLVLGSRSTHLRSRIGGLQGRALQAGDRLLLGRTRMAPAGLALPAGALDAFYRRDALRVVPGPHADCLADPGALFGPAYRLSARSDRMGYQLDGPAVALKDKAELDSHAVATGALQVLPSGTPVVLLADRQTTGGYPLAGVVASADLHLLGQLKPGDELRFAAVKVDEAQRALRAQERALAELVSKAARC